MGYRCDQLHIGPAVKFNKVARTVKRSVETCTNPECKHHKSKRSITTKFCENCGSPVTTQVFDKEVTLSFYDFANETGASPDTFFHPPHDEDGIWLDNTNSQEEDSFYHGELEEETIEFPEDFFIKREVHLRRFNEKHAALFEAMRAFGLDFEVLYVLKSYGY